MRTRRHVQTHATGDQVAQGHLDFWVLLECIHGGHALFGAVGSGDGDCLVTQRLLVFGNALALTGKHHDLLTSGQYVLDTLGTGGVFGLVERHAQLSDASQEFSVIGPGRVGVAEPA